MAEFKSINLTDDPLTNINIMTPMLDDEGRRAMSYLMYGYFLRGQVEKTADIKELQEA